MIISILHTSKEQPDKAVETWAEWTLKASNRHPYEYILSLNEKDTKLDSYVEQFKGRANISISKDELLHNARRMASGNLYVQLSDGISCSNDWDDLLIKQLPKDAVSSTTTIDAASLNIIYTSND